MLLLAADENLNNKLVRGLQRLNRGIDVLRVQDAGLGCAVRMIPRFWLGPLRRFGFC
ncbi:MAG: hypothetical protein L0H64_01145 [Pseudonocardia sp.]|nr:hypothetical protein [Pseudonocardia sp.]